VTAAYVDQTAVETYLGRSLTAAEAAQFSTVADAATEAIDRYTGRSWQASTVTAELHTVLGRTVRLDVTPVSAISLVRMRSQAIGASWTTLADGTGYELLDAAGGLLALSGAYDVIASDSPGYGQILEVTYTVGGGVPAPITLAAEMLVAGSLASAQGVSNQAQGIKSYSVGGELSVTYFTSTELGNASASAALPAGVRALLDAYRRPVVFA